MISCAIWHWVCWGFKSGSCGPERTHSCRLFSWEIMNWFDFAELNIFLRTHTHARTHAHTHKYIYIFIYIYIYMYIYICSFTTPPKIHYCQVGWGCRIHWQQLCRGVRPPLPMSALDLTLNNLMVRLQWRWGFGEYGAPLHCHCSQVLSGPAW